MPIAAPAVLVRRVAHDLAVRCDHDRRLVRVDSEPVEQGVRVLVLLQVDPLMRHPVADQELPQPPGVGREPRTDQLDPGSDADQDRAPGHEGPEDDVAERLVLGDELAQLLDRDLDHLAGLPDDSGQIETLAGQHGELAQKATGAVDGDHPVLLAVALDDHNRARLDDEEVAALVALARTAPRPARPCAHARGCAVAPAVRHRVGGRRRRAQRSLPPRPRSARLRRSRHSSPRAPGTIWASWRQCPSRRTPSTKNVGVP